mmetsp:Transcript_9173/g.14097  ORF Transcript_9173/g.14097 Transcript_9173/m.14097 type:complete len:259 (+) Transcript_9173:56-832(+)
MVVPICTDDSDDITGGDTEIAITVVGSLRLILLQQIMFFRAYLVLKGTTYAFGKCAVGFWIGSCVVLNVLVVVAMLLYYGGLNENIGFLMTNFLQAMNVVFVIWVNSVFVHKLRTLHKTVKDDQMTTDRLLPLITKITILSLSSCITMFISMAIGAAFFAPLAQGVYIAGWHFLYTLGGCVDALFNYLTIYLSFRVFDVLYQRFCGNCQRGCHSMCVRCSGTTDAKRLSQTAADNNMPSATDQDDATVATTTEKTDTN